MKISVFGLGYVGAVSVGCLSDDGHTVIGVDPNNTKVDMLNRGQSPIVEDAIGSLLKAGRQEGRISATDNAQLAVDRSDISLVCVGTPSRSNGSLDLKYVEAVCTEIGTAIKDKPARHNIVMRSTMLPGSMRETVIPVLEAVSGKSAGRDFSISNNPEFLREGTAVFDYRNPPKTVIGEIQPGDADMLASIYAHLDAPMIRTSIETAEMVKYVDNVWHALKVGFANEIGNIAKQLGIDGQEVMEIFCKDEKLNLSSYYLRPGFAFGGSCLPKDLRALTYKAARMDIDVPILNSILPSNVGQIERVLDTIQRSGARKIGVLGFSFKSGTDDLRESPVVELIERLMGKGFELLIYDQYVNVAKLIGANRDYILNAIPHISRIMVDDVAAITDNSELIVIGNGSAEFADILEKVTATQQVLDLVGVAKPAQAVANYNGVGW
ncbi:MAG TPA: nucleotide sugar dehydrogenase [Woeseiaceae bacterium]|nr:nucleotide sugar dehydrogenase [Woeseiaceae bacterium]